MATVSPIWWEVVAVLVHLIQPHLGDVVVVDLEPRLVIPDQVRFLLQRYEVRLSAGTVPPSTRSVLQTSALRARSG